MDDMEKRKFLPYWDSNFDPLVVQPIDNRYTDCATLALMFVLLVAGIG
jgi:hypothetical protein